MLTKKTDFLSICVLCLIAVIVIAIFAHRDSTDAPKPNPTSVRCTTCSCGYKKTLCSKECEQKHDISNNDYDCRMACHCKAVNENRLPQCDIAIPKKYQKADSANEGSPELTLEYDYVNARYFGGSLPFVEVQISKDDQSQWESDDKWIAQTTTCGPRCFNIVISDPFTPALKQKQWALMHEMCHVYDSITGFELQAHGPKWQGCMLGLAKEGAFTFVW